MTLADRILRYIIASPGRDDDEISDALGLSSRQAVNQECRLLARRGLIQREVGKKGKLVNIPSGTPLEAPLVSMAKLEAASGTAVSDPTAEWFWEGNVCDRLVASLVARGWRLETRADTRARQRGVDLHMRGDDREILFEVKGYPSTLYRDPNKRHKEKRTSPRLQAQHWYAGGILQVFRLMSKYPTALCALALPDMVQYRQIFEDTSIPLLRAGVAVVFVGQAGELHAVGMPVNIEE